jgi:hypothetical protein
VKKGLYVFGERLRKRTISRELLSNLIYGPSYVSMEFALQRHGLIPEEVPVVSAVTIRRSRWFNTPLGMFTYSSIPVEAYPAGITLNRSDHTSFFIATPEKALADLVHHRRGLSLRSTHDVESFLEEDLRIESESIRDLNPAVLREILGRPSSVKVKYFITTLLRHYLEAHHA